MRTITHELVNLAGYRPYDTAAQRAHLRDDMARINALCGMIEDATPGVDGWDWVENWVGQTAGGRYGQSRFTPARMESACVYNPIEPVYDVYGV